MKKAKDKILKVVFTLRASRGRRKLMNSIRLTKNSRRNRWYSLLENGFQRSVKNAPIA